MDLEQLDGFQALSDRSERTAGIELGKLSIVADEDELRLRTTGGVGEHGEVPRADHAGLVGDQHRPGCQFDPALERQAQSRDRRGVDPGLVAQFARGAGRERAAEYRHA